MAGLRASPKAHRAPPVEGPLPRGRCSRDADGDTARDQFGSEAVGLPGRFVDKRVLRHGVRCRLAAVDGAHLPRLRVVEHEVAATADPGAVRLGHAEGGGGGDSGVRRVAAFAEDFDRRGGSLRVHGAHGTAVPGGRRVLDGFPRIGEGGAGDGAARQADCQCRSDGNESTCHMCHGRSRIRVIRVDRFCHATTRRRETQYGHLREPPRHAGPALAACGRDQALIVPRMRAWRQVVPAGQGPEAFSPRQSPALQNFGHVEKCFAAGNSD